MLEQIQIGFEFCTLPVLLHVLHRLCAQTGEVKGNHTAARVLALTPTRKCVSKEQNGRREE